MQVAEKRAKREAALVERAFRVMDKRAPDSALRWLREGLESMFREAELRGLLVEALENLDKATPGLKDRLTVEMRRIVAAAQGRVEGANVTVALEQVEPMVEPEALDEDEDPPTEDTREIE